MEMEEIRQEELGIEQIKEEIKKAEEELVLKYKKLKEEKIEKGMRPVEEPFKLESISDILMDFEEAKSWVEKRGGRLPTTTELLLNHRYGFSRKESCWCWVGDRENGIVNLGNGSEGTMTKYRNGYPKKEDFLARAICVID
jgi:hypothetical protein